MITFMHTNLHFRGMCGVYLPTVTENRNNFLAGNKKRSTVFPTSLDAASDKGHPVISEVLLRVAYRSFRFLRRGMIGGRGRL